MFQLLLLVAVCVSALVTGRCLCFSSCYWSAAWWWVLLEELCIRQPGDLPEVSEVSGVSEVSEVSELPEGSEVSEGSVWVVLPLGLA